MNLYAVMKEAAEVLGEISGLRVEDHPSKSVVAPAGYVSYPQSVDYDQTYGRGYDKFTGLPMTLLFSEVTGRTAAEVAGDWSDGANPQSVKALMEQHDWRSCSEFRVTGCTFDVETVGAVPYLAVVFTADIMGRGN